MSLDRRTVISQREIAADGTVQVRFEKLIVDGDAVVSRQYHRASFQPGTPVAAQMAAVNAHLVQMGEAPVAESEVESIERIVKLEHTPEVIEAFLARERDRD